MRVGEGEKRTGQRRHFLWRRGLPGCGVVHHPDAVSSVACSRPVQVHRSPPVRAFSSPGPMGRRCPRNSCLRQHNRTEVVACLTMTEFNLFRNIRLREFLDKTWLTEQMSSLVYVMVSPPPLVDECPYPCSAFSDERVVLKIQGE